MDVFISYSRKDRAGKESGVDVISRIQNALKEAGVSYWLDEEGIHSGETFASVISRNIAESKVFLFVSSINSNASRWTCGEIATANSYDKRIIPFKIDNAPYDPSVTIYLAALDTIDYLANPDKALKRLVKSVRTYLSEIDEEERRREEQRLWLAEQERIAAEREQIKAENKKIIARLEITKEELEEKIRSVDERMDDMLKEKNRLLGEMTEFKLRISELRDESSWPVWYPTKVEKPNPKTIVHAPEPDERDEEFNIEEDNTSVPDHAASSISSGSEDVDNKKSGASILFIAECALIVVLGLCLGLSLMSRKPKRPKSDTAAVVTVSDDYAAVNNNDVFSAPTAIEPVAEVSSDKDALAAQEQFVMEDDKKKEEPIERNEDEVEVDSPIDNTNRYNIHWITFDPEASFEKIDLQSVGGTDTVLVSFSTGEKWNRRGFKIKEQPEWCTINKTDKGFLIHYRSYFNSNPERIKGLLERYAIPSSRDSIIVFTHNNKEYTLEVSQKNSYRGNFKQSNTPQKNEPAVADNPQDSSTISSNQTKITPGAERETVRVQENPVVAKQIDSLKADTVSVVQEPKATEVDTRKEKMEEKGDANKKYELKFIKTMEPIQFEEEGISLKYWKYDYGGEVIYITDILTVGMIRAALGKKVQARDRDNTIKDQNFIGSDDYNWFRNELRVRTKLDFRAPEAEEYDIYDSLDKGFKGVRLVAKP